MAAIRLIDRHRERHRERGVGGGQGRERERERKKEGVGGTAQIGEKRPHTKREREGGGGTDKETDTRRRRRGGRGGHRKMMLAVLFNTPATCLCVSGIEWLQANRQEAVGGGGNRPKKKV